jgi:hypothetical protein
MGLNIGITNDYLLNSPNVASAVEKYILWAKARQGGSPGLKPSLDLDFARNKSLIDNVTGSNLVTFTRASSGTFVGSDGVIRTAVTNLALRSEEFDNASWTRANAAAPTANTDISPTGTLTAEKFIGDNAITAGSAQILQDVAGQRENVAYTVSVYAKAAGQNSFRIQLNARSSGGTLVGAVTYSFALDSATGSSTFVSTAGTAPTSDSASITPVGNGWFRCRVTATTPATTATVRALIASNVTSNGTDGFLLWGAQLEQSSTVGEYIPTTSTINSAPRFDHNPTTGESLGLLVEEQRTNSIRNNTMVGAVAGTPGTLPTNWSGSAATDLTREVVGTGTENGVAYIDLKYTGTVSASRTQFVFFEPSNQIAASNGQSWAGSAWVKIVAGSLANITSVAIQTDTRDASLVYVSTPFVVAFTPTSAFTRYSGAGAATGATINWIQPFVRFITASSGTIDITLRIGLPQLEQGAFATSVIPTTTATVTRSADVASISGSNFSGWFNQTEGSLCARFLLSQISNTPLLADVNDSSTANRFALAMSTGRNGQLFVNTASTSQGTTTTTNAANIGALASLAFAYKADDCNVVLNGGSVATDTSVSLPVVNNLFIGFRTSNQYLNSSISRLTYWPTRLPNSTLQAVTQ